jgi:hypothetical protein
MQNYKTVIYKTLYFLILYNENLLKLKLND